MTKFVDKGLQRELRLEPAYQNTIEPSEHTGNVYELQDDLFGGPSTCAKVRKTKVIEIPEEDRREPSERGQFSAGRGKRR